MSVSGFLALPHATHGRSSSPCSSSSNCLVRSRGPSSGRPPRLPDYEQDAPWEQPREDVANVRQQDGVNIALGVFLVIHLAKRQRRIPGALAANRRPPRRRWRSGAPRRQAHDRRPHPAPSAYPARCLAGAARCRRRSARSSAAGAQARRRPCRGSERPFRSASLRLSRRTTLRSSTVSGIFLMPAIHVAAQVENSRSS